MKPGEAFEIKCYNYLTENYKTERVKFHREGGMDSTKSDIAVIKNGHIDFFIEAKDAIAQSGQFVLIPNETAKTFVFSPRNRCQKNEMTDIIIEYMNRDFDRFNNASTSGEALNLDTSVFANWIVEHYKEKNVKYFISYKNDFVILPIRKFAENFNISANYRIKKSGSGEPAKKDIEAVKQAITSFYSSAIFSQKDKKLYVQISQALTTDRFILGKYTYYLSNQNDDFYEIRRLSNTNNMNVIFSIELTKSQNEADLKEFEAEIY